MADRYRSRYANGLAVDDALDKGVIAYNEVDVISGAEPFLNFDLIEGSYVDNITGAIIPYEGWSRSDYLPIPNTKKFTFNTGDSTYNDKYNCFYDENKNFISSFTIHKGEIEEVSIPSGAKYVIFSGNYYFISQLTVSYHTFATKLNVCSFNVGLWNNGVTQGVPPEQVKAKAIAWHKFLGDFNPDFLLCEEAVKYFDTESTVDAYEKNLKFKYSFKWMDSNTTHSLSTKQILICGKYPIENLRVHAFASGSNRAFITFESTIGGKTVNFIVVHLSIEENSSGNRQRDMAELATLMSTYQYGILTGDFNTYTIEEFDTHFSNFNMANHGDFGDYPTWDHEQGSWNKCLDNVITTRNITIQNVRMGSVSLSDHEPIMAELTIN